MMGECIASVTFIGTGGFLFPQVSHDGHHADIVWLSFDITAEWCLPNVEAK